ncbi:MAG: quinolinate synthase NadA [Actinobacteria bacterium]|nr:quinolinate synthase NadA [Actinomycetota bacterium]
MDYMEEISRLRKKQNAVILAHNYQVGEVQDIADFVGDSLELSIIASKIDAKRIIFCGVHFMAETASILASKKEVYLPVLTAGCPMANMITPQALKEKKREHSDAAVVCYVNSSAEVKSLSDICCTSSNAVNVVNSIDSNKQILFVPDMYLGDYVRKRSGREMILWNGYCPTHARILPEDIIKQKEVHAKAKVVVHPECKPSVIELADAARSTSGILAYCHETDSKEFIIGTEVGILHRLKKENPEKKFFPASIHAVCPNMKKTTLADVYNSLSTLSNRITVPVEIAMRARNAIELMVKITPTKD